MKGNKMDKVLEEKLWQRFKWLQAHNAWTGRKLKFCTPMSFSNGWYQLIYDMCEAIEEHYKKNNAKTNTIQILQVKEKYAGLCFYTGGLIEGTHKIIHEFEKKSTTVCECCSKPGNVKHRGSWLRTLCTDCAEEQGYVEFEDDEEDI